MKSRRMTAVLDNIPVFVLEHEEKLARDRLLAEQAYNGTCSGYL